MNLWLHLRARENVWRRPSLRRPAFLSYIVHQKQPLCIYLLQNCGHLLLGYWDCYLYLPPVHSLPVYLCACTVQQPTARICTQWFHLSWHQASFALVVEVHCQLIACPHPTRHLYTLGWGFLPYVAGCL